MSSIISRHFGSGEVVLVKYTKETSLKRLSFKGPMIRCATLQGLHHVAQRSINTTCPLYFDRMVSSNLSSYYPMELSIENLKRLPWCRFQDEYIFVEPSDKAAGIHRILDHFGGSAEDAIVFGDSKNDLSMFGDDGSLRVAMGNAPDDQKEKADFVTTDVDKEGIWNACMELGLIIL